MILTSAPGFDPRSDNVSLTEGMNGHDIVLTPQIATVSGVVSANTGGVIEGANVTSGNATATTGADGRFELLDLRAGGATIVTSAPGYATLSQSVSLIKGANTHDVALTAVENCDVVRPTFGIATEEERSLFAYDVNAPLNLQRQVVDTIYAASSGVETSNISYSSGDQVVTGQLLDPVTRPGMRPGIVMLHGSGGTAYDMRPWAFVLADVGGAVVITINAPFVRRGATWLQFTEQDRIDQIQLMKDLQRAVDVLRAHAHVDEERIAFYGLSYGAAMGVLFAGIEHRIKAAALVVGYPGNVTQFTNGVNSSLYQLPCAQRNAWFRAMTPIEPIRFISYASPTALLFQNGRLDAAVLPADAEVLHAAAPEPSRVLWYDADHILNDQAFRDRVNWLHEQIGTDPMPNTK